MNIRLLLLSIILNNDDFDMIIDVNLYFEIVNNAYFNIPADHVMMRNDYPHVYLFMRDF